MPNNLHTLPNIMADFAMPVLEKVLANFSSFTTNFTVENRRTIEVDHHTDMGSTEKNPSDYTKTEDTTVAVPVPVDEYSQQFGITSQEALLGHRLELRIKRNAHVLANTLWDVVAAQINTTNFPRTPVDTINEEDFNHDQIKALYAGLAGAMSKHLLLSPLSYAETMVVVDHDTSVAGAARYSYDSIWEVNKWDATGLQANAHGFACGPESFLLGSGIPRYTNRVMEVLDEEIATLPETGLSVAFRHQVDINSRSEHASMDVLFGAVPGDGNAGTIIRTGV